MYHKTGASFDSTKDKLKKLQERADTHDLAVSKVIADFPDSAAVAAYKREWEDYKKKLATTRADSDSWTSAVMESTADNLNTEFGILLTKFATLSARLTLERGAEKQKALEWTLQKAGKVPVTQDPYRTEHQAVVKTDAKALSDPLDPNNAITKVVAVGIVGGVLYLIYRIGRVVMRVVL